MSIAEESAELKRCSNCFEEQPITEFRRRWKTSERRHSQCRKCYNAEHRERKKARRRHRVIQYSAEVAAARRSRNQLIALSSRLVKEFGGIDAVAGHFKETFDAALASGQYSVVHRLLSTLLDLSAIADQLTRERLNEMSTSELEEELVRGVAADLLAKSSDSVSRAATAASLPGTVSPFAG